MSTISSLTPPNSIYLLRRSNHEALDTLVRHLDTIGSFSSLSLTVNPMVDAIVRYGEVAVPHLETGLSNDTIRIREQACVALGVIGGEKVENVLMRALNGQTDRGVRDCVAGALRQIEINRRQKQRGHTTK
jgi:HEAT repeat protein